MNPKKIIVACLAIFLVFSANHLALAATGDVEKPKSVVLFIGDGMGANQVKATEIYARDVLKKDLAITSIRTSGITTTHSASSSVTDSAAAATAIYTGYKTNNGHLNVLPDGRRVDGIGVASVKSGLSVGIISTARLTDATPAAIYANSQRRDSHNEIAGQLPDFGADVVLGVGQSHFAPSSHKDSDRKDETDVIAIMRNKGYDFVKNLSQLNAVNPDNTKKLFGMFSPSNMPYAIDRENTPALSGAPNLADMTKVALSIMGKNPKGFLLVIEGGRIDHACHANDIKTMILETLEFDEAVGVALKYRETHPDVLVIVTGDHETGGLRQTGEGAWSIDSGAILPIKRSLGAIEDKIRKNPEQEDAILKASGLELTPEEAELLRSYKVRAEQEKPTDKTAKEKASDKKSSGILNALSMITSQRAGVEWTTNGHTGLAVITRAVGPGAQLFSGDYDNTDIALKIAELLNLSIPRLTEQNEKKAGIFIVEPTFALVRAANAGNYPNSHGFVLTIFAGIADSHGTPVWQSPHPYPSKP